MNKRALMLTAATAALMTGPAYAACTGTPNWTTISTKLTTNVDTACANNGAPGTITITTSGSVVISTTPYTTPAVTIDSGTTAAPGTVSNTGLISYTGVAAAVGVDMPANGDVGELDNKPLGIIDMTGTGTSKIGILVGLPTGASTGTFTGVVQTTAVDGLPNTSPYAFDTVAINLEATSVLKVEGTGSYGIQTLSGTTLVGDIDIAGALTMTPVSTTSTSTTGNYAMFIGGAMTGNILVLPGGAVESIGDGAIGIATAGAINGAIVNYGSISAVGTTTPGNSSSMSNPEAGTAIDIGANVTGGIYNAGPTSLSDTATRAAISTQGASPAFIISTTVGNGTPAATEIGYYNDSNYGNATYSFVNRGVITTSSIDPNISVTNISLQGSSSTVNVLFDGGIFNSGSITAIATNDNKGSAVTASAFFIGDAVQIGNTAQYSTISQLVNNNTESSGGGVIEASVSGPFGGTAYGVQIGQTGMLNSINNSGIIEATAATTDTTINALAAYAIYDEGGSSSITNITNSGTILAQTTTLDNNLQIARAIDLFGSTQNVVVTNTGQIKGDIVFGTGQNTVTDVGGGASSQAVIQGNIYFGGNVSGFDNLNIGDNGTFTGSVFEGTSSAIGFVNVDVQPGGSFFLQNSTLPGQNTAKPVNAHDFKIENGGLLNILISQPFNLNGVNPVTGLSQAGVGAIIQANTVEIGLLDPVKGFNLSFGSFLASPGLSTVSFALISAPTSAAFSVSPTELNQMALQVDTTIPFLFKNTDALCTQNVTGSPIACTGITNPATDAEIDLILQPKNQTDLGLTGYAKLLFPYANAALATDSTLGAGVIAAVTNNTEAQRVYASFAPDVSGATRATAISLTDSATNIVSARQRELRMYANQDGDTTLWGQEFAEKLGQDNTSGTLGFNSTGFGFALGMDSGDPSDGRYGGAFTFFSGGETTKDPVDAKTHGLYYLGTFYTDWRGKGFFLDSQLEAGWGTLAGQRFLTVGTPSAPLTRTADGDRPTQMLAGGLTTGAIFNFGGTVVTPQLSLDGLTMREEGYSESNGGNLNGGDGFDLRVQPYYANSARAFLGVDLREDINFGDFYLQPQMRAGYRYDFLNGAVKLKANFVGVTPVTPATQFSITGPDPSKGNIVLGGGMAVTTGAWSIGVSYDYLRASSGNTQQDGMITLLGRI